MNKHDGKYKYTVDGTVEFELDVTEVVVFFDEEFEPESNDLPKRFVALAEEALEEAASERYKAMGQDRFEVEIEYVDKVEKD